MKKKKALIFISAFLIAMTIIFGHIGTVRAAMSVTKDASGVYYGTNAHSAVFSVLWNNSTMSDGVSNGFCLQPRYSNSSTFSSYTTLKSSNDSSYYYTASGGKLPLRAIVYYAYNAPGWKKHSSDLTTFYSKHFSGHKSYNANVYHTISALPISYAFSLNSNFSGVSCGYNTSDSYSGTSTACDWNLGYNTSTSKNFVDTQVNGWKNDITSLLNQMYTWWQTDKNNLGGTFEAYYSHADSAQDLVAWWFKADEKKALIKIKKSFTPSASARTTKFTVYKCAGTNCSAQGASVGSVTLDSDNDYTGYVGWDYDNNVATLEPNTTYLVWENGEVGGSTAAKAGYTSDGYKISFNNPVVLKYSGDNKYYTYDKVTTSSYSSSWSSYYATSSVKNTKKGYLKVKKTFSPANTSDTVTIDIYPCATTACNYANASDKIDSVTINSSQTGTLGVDSNGHAMLDLNKTYLLRERGEQGGYKGNYVVSFSGAASKVSGSDGYTYGKVSSIGTASKDNTGYYKTANIKNTEKTYGHIVVQKSLSGVSLSTYRFKFNICKVSGSSCTAVSGSPFLTDSSGKVTYGLNSSNKPTLASGSTYRISEVVNASTGLARVYNSSGTEVSGTLFVKPSYSGSNSYETVTISTVGTTQSTSINSKTITNVKQFGSLKVTKKIDGSGVSSASGNYFKFKICKVSGSSCTAVSGSPFITSSTGIVTYGLNSSNKPTLEYGDVYRITEVTDNNGYAIVYDSSGNVKTSNLKVQPDYSNLDYEEVTITTLGTDSTAVNSTTLNNEVKKGYIKVQKNITKSSSDESSYSLSDNRFAFDVYNNGSKVGTIYTDSTGVATYGLSSNQPTLTYGSTYEIVEVVDGNNHAKIYEYSNGRYTLKNTDLVVTPAGPATVTISNLGSNIAGINSTTINNNVEYGYLKIEKKKSGTGSIDTTTNHFGFDVYEEQSNNYVLVGTIYTDNNGIATYGLNGNTPLLKKGSKYRIREVMDSSNTYAKIFNASGQEISSTLEVSPVYSESDSVGGYVPTEITNVGSTSSTQINSVNVFNAEAEDEYGYLKVKKEVTGEFGGFSSYHFKINICKIEGNSCTPVTGSPFYTNNSGEIYYYGETGQISLELNDKYRVTEETEIINGETRAVLYNSSNQKINSTHQDYIPMIPSVATEDIQITNVGLNGENLSHIKNTVDDTPVYGYLKIQKDINNLNFSTYHFGFEICKVENSTCTPVTGSPFYTDNNGKVTYGLNAGVPELEQGTVYRITEIVDSNNYAVLYTNSSGSGTINSSNNLYKQIRPVYPVGQNYIEVTINNSESNEETYVELTNIEITILKGYIEFQKTVSNNSSFDFNANRFMFNVYLSTDLDTVIDTVMTDETGKITYGKDSSGNGTLSSGDTYVFIEHTSGDYAIVYDSNGNEISNAPKLIPSYVSSSNDVRVKIDNVGSGSAGKNVGDTVDNNYLGYIEFQKTVSGNSTFDFNANRFKFNVYLSTDLNTVIDTVMTDETGKITYGKDSSGNGTLSSGDTYVFKEQTSGDYAIVYDSNENEISNAPKLIPSYVSSSNDVRVKIDNVGSGSAGKNVGDTVDNKYLGYIEFQKTVSDNSTFDFNANRFIFNVYLSTDLDTVIDTVMTDETGKITYGKDSSGNGTLNKGVTYVFKEHKLGNYAIVYDSNENEISNAPKLIPSYTSSSNDVRVKIDNVGSESAGKNVGDTVDNKYLGYVGVQKTVNSGSSEIDFNTFHFAYNVYNSNNSIIDRVCTNTAGKAIYGLDESGNGSLISHSSYEFREVVSNGKAVVYSDSNCTVEADEDLNPPSISPASSSVRVTVFNTGPSTSGYNEQNYINGYSNCLNIQKKDGSDNIIDTNDVTFELYDNNVCVGNVVATATTVNGIATFTGLTGTQYYVKETSSPIGYSIVGNNCTSVTATEQTTSSTVCNTTNISNIENYVGFYKTKEDGTPLTEATFKIKDSNGKYVTVSSPVSGQYNGCYIYTGANSEGTVLSVNNSQTGLFCVAKIPSGTYIAEEQSTGNDSYWIDEGIIRGISTNTSVPTKGNSNTIKNSPFVITFYKTRDSKSGSPIENTKFKIKEQGTDNYISVGLQSNVTGYEGCYTYTGTTTEANASEVKSDSNGRVCVIRVKGNTTYEAVETESGDTSYFADGSISVSSKQIVDTKNDDNTLVNYSYKLSFYKEKEDRTPLTGATFVVKKGTDFLKVSAIGTDTNNRECYVYNGVTRNESEASTMTTDSNGRICISGVTNSNDYVAKEKNTGNQAYYIFENGEINLVPGREVRGKEASNTLVNKPYLINFYKVLENNTTPVGGAEFLLTDTTGKYIEVEGTSEVSGYNGCYIYKGLSDTKTNKTTLVASTENKSNGVSIGEVCVIKIPQGTYKVTETKPVEYHTFGNDTSKNFSTSKSRQNITNDNKFVNNKTVFEFTKTVTDENGYDSVWQNLSTEELKNIPFIIYDSNDNPVSVIQTSEGVYEYANNTVDGTSGTSTTTLYLNSDRKIKVYHLPKGSYKIKELECCCDDVCDSPSTNNCYGFYSPNYGDNSGYSYSFTITDCSTDEQTGVDENGNRVCSVGKSTQSLDNTPTSVTFTKQDFYSYVNPSDTVKFENEEEISAFDGITFKVYYLENGVKHYLDFAKVGDIGTCKTEASYSEYRFIENASGIETTNELHTCGGHIKITHLCRGRKYYIEEVSVPSNTVFTLPENEADRIKEIDLDCCQEKEDVKPSSTVIISDTPTRIPFEKRDSKYGYLIPDEKTTFEVYKCPIGTECHPGDYVTLEERESNGMTLVRFNPRGVISGDEEDSNIDVYRAVTNVDNVTNYVTDLHPYQGKLVLRYLEAGYNYVLLETTSPDGYKLPNGRNAETRFSVSSESVSVEEVDIPNKPTSLLIRKYDDAGNLLPGAQFRIYESTTCDKTAKLQEVDKTLLNLKTIRDGVYENREIKDTDLMITCEDKLDSKCSDIDLTLTHNSYIDTWTNFDNSINQNNESIEINEGEILIQYLDYGKCYIIEEVKAPTGYSLPDNDDDRFTLVEITKESDVVDTLKDMINKPTPFTFYKYDEYNNLIDGGEFKLQKLNSKKKYEDVTVTELIENDHKYYKVDKNSTNKTITTINGSATVYYLEEGQYRIVETKAPSGMELPNKEINVAVFYVDEGGRVVGNSIITNKPKTEKIVIKPTAQAELIVNISTGVDRVRYVLIITIILISIGGLIYIQKIKKKEY